MRTPVEHLIWLIMDPQQMEIYKEEIEQALQMEKEHIIDAYMDGASDEHAGIYSKKSINEYYNETFKSE